jgi:hypothetical protein
MKIFTWIRSSLVGVLSVAIMLLVDTGSRTGCNSKMCNAFACPERRASKLWRQFTPESRKGVSAKSSY